MKTSLFMLMPKDREQYLAVMSILKEHNVLIAEQVHYGGLADKYADGPIYHASSFKYFGVRSGTGTYVTDLASHFINPVESVDATDLNSIKAWAEANYPIDNEEQASEEPSEEPSEAPAEPKLSIPGTLLGFDECEVILHSGKHTVRFNTASQAALGNQPSDPVPALTCITTLEQLADAIDDDSVIVLWGVSSDGALIKPFHLYPKATLSSARNMMKQGVYVAAKK